MNPVIPEPLVPGCNIQGLGEVDKMHRLGHTYARWAGRQAEALAFCSEQETKDH